MRWEEKDSNNQILMGVYRSSWGITTLTLAVVVSLEVFMLVYSVINSALYGEHLWKYRSFYIALLTAALFYIFLNMFVKKDIEHRFLLLNVANPVYACFFFAWSLGITWSDVLITGVVDPAVFMTFSLVVPLCFYLFPSIYTVIVTVADVVMIYLTVSHPGYIGVLINLSIFIIFQFVLGISFLRLKMKLTKRIIEERRNALIDVLTGFPNRRSYTEDMNLLLDEPRELVYIVIDLNGLKEVNDSLGHDAGDQMIMGATECIGRCFENGKPYRIGGDEFVVMISEDMADVEKGFDTFEKDMKAWSEHHGIELSASYGFVSSVEYPESSILELARKADERMYEAKARYYHEKGVDRRRYKNL